MKIFSTFSHHTRNASLYLGMLGSLLILFGLLLIVMPELLSYIVSFFFVASGAAALVGALKLWQTERHIRSRVNHVTGTLKNVTNRIHDTFDNL